MMDRYLTETELLMVIHKLETKLGRRFNDEEYSRVFDMIESELRMVSIREGMNKLYEMFG